MNTTVYQDESFESKLAEKLAKDINQESNTLFELFMQQQNWIAIKRELEYDYRDYINADKSKKNGWLFFLFILLPVLAMIDYASIAQFIAYLAKSSGGGFIGGILSIVGWLFFILLELAAGWLLLHAKNNILLKGFSIILAIVLIVLPSYLIYTTYSINPDKTGLLYRKTIALVIVSLIVHAIFFLVIKDIWAGIHYILYIIKSKLHNSRHPHKSMQEIIERLQASYHDFDKYTAALPPSGKAAMLHNRTWYIRRKITTGQYETQYDLSDYNQEASYVESGREQKHNGIYHYTIKR